MAEQYFALSGLRTNLGLLDGLGKPGVTQFRICVVAFLAKFIPCSRVPRCPLSASIFESQVLLVRSWPAKGRSCQYVDYTSAHNFR